MKGFIGLREKRGSLWRGSIALFLALPLLFSAASARRATAAQEEAVFGEIHWYAAPNASAGEPLILSGGVLRRP